VQLEKVIGKVKTRKYNSRILELMRSHTGSGTKQGKEGSERGAKKIKKKDKDVVYVESGEEE
jgi:ATP-dependent DNA helicase Q1